MQPRENLANDHETMSRTQLQRVYENIFLRDLYARTHGRDQASAANIAAEYAKVRSRCCGLFADRLRTRLAA